MRSHFFSRARAAVAAMAVATGACASDATPPGAPQTNQPGGPYADGVAVAWNGYTRTFVVRYNTSAPVAVRNYTLVAVAQERTLAAVPTGGRPANPRTDAVAISAAAATVLASLYPAEAAFVDGEVTAIASAVEASPTEISTGQAIGRRVAAEILAAAASDGFFTPFTGVVPTCPGCWRAVPTPPALATLGQARPWLLSSTSQFRPAPPPAFGSPGFSTALAEVRMMSDTRTPAQDSIAKVWALQTGTLTTQGYWNKRAADLLAAAHLPERRAVRLLAAMNMAGYDALLASHEAKYTYWVLRPSQADPGITLAIGLPSFPAYPSNHAAISAAAATVIAAYFPGQFRQLRDEAEMAGLSRLYGGIHYRFDMDAGLELGRKVGALGVAALHEPPTDQGPFGHLP